MAVPTSWFSNIVTTDGFGVAGASLSHFVCHVNIVCSTCRHVRRNFRRHFWYLLPRIQSVKFTEWTQFFFFQRVVQADSAWCSILSRSSLPTETRRRFVLWFPRPQDEDSFYRMQQYKSLNAVAFLTDATLAHDFGSMKDPVPSKTTQCCVCQPLLILPARACGPWLPEMSVGSRCHPTVSFGAKSQCMT